MTTTTPKAIVIAWVELDGLAPTGRMVRFDGYNYKPEFQTVPQGHAAMWLNRGTDRDIEAAEAHIRRNELDRPLARVYSYPAGRGDYLGQARRQILKDFVAQPAGREK